MPTLCHVINKASESLSFIKCKEQYSRNSRFFQTHLQYLGWSPQHKSVLGTHINIHLLT